MESTRIMPLNSVTQTHIPGSIYIRCGTIKSKKEKQQPSGHEFDLDTFEWKGLSITHQFVIMRLS